MHSQKLATVLSIVALVALITMPAGAAEVNRSWEKLVDSAKVGKKVVVKRMNSTQVEGKLLRITADSITVQWRGQSELVSRGDVWQVRYSSKRGRNALIGLGVGAGIAMAIWAANPGTANPAGEAAAGVIFLGGGGAALGALGSKGKTLYEAPVGPRK